MSSPSAPGDDLDGPETLSPIESLDADELDDDPFNRARDDFEAPMDPPEHWAGADKFGTTANEMTEGESLDQRLSEEVPDVAPVDVPEVPLAALPDDQLDESVDDVDLDGAVVVDESGVPTGTAVAPDGKPLVGAEATLVREPDEPAADETLTIVEDSADLGLADTDR